MKKSDKQFSVTVNGKTTDVGTRSGVANFVRQNLENAEAGKDVNFTVHVAAAPATEKPEKAEGAAATDTTATQ